MDTKILLQHIDLRSLAEQAGARFSSGNSSRCPLHHGNNPTAFHIYQGQDGIWRWHCFTNCPEDSKGGDAIRFYMRWRDVDFKTAVDNLARMYGVSADERQTRRPAMPAPDSTRSTSIKPACGPHNATWQKRAGEFAAYAARELVHDDDALLYLARRGLRYETAKAFRLGYNPKDIHDHPGRWGLTGNPVWLPEGIVIPHYNGESVTFCNIRRIDGEPKYCGPRGGQRGLYPSNAMIGHPITLLAEGEFDALLAWQCAHDLCDHGTLGGARHHIDEMGALTLARSLSVMVVLDDDLAGAMGKIALGALGERMTMIQPPAHDLTDYWISGGDLRAWIAGQIVAVAGSALAGVDEYEQPDLFMRWLEVYTKALEVSR